MTHTIKTIPDMLIETYGNQTEVAGDCRAIETQSGVICTTKKRVSRHR